MSSGNCRTSRIVATEVTDKGIERLCEYVAAVREDIGYDMPLSMEHPGTSDEVSHSPRQSVREIQLRMNGGRHTLVLHGSFERDHAREPYVHSHWRRLQN
jgi:hypothetical protein